MWGVLGTVKPYRIARDEADEYFASFKKFKKLVELLAKAGLMAKGTRHRRPESKPETASGPPLHDAVEERGGVRRAPRTDRPLEGDDP
jgi:hypothetical protein